MLPLMAIPFPPMTMFAGAAVGISLVPVLGCRRTKFAGGAVPMVFVFSCAHPVWMAFLGLVLWLPSNWQFLAFLAMPSDESVMLAVTAVGYALLLGIAAQSWKVAVAILACGAASIMVDYAVSRTGFIPSICLLCFGVVSAPAIDTLARAGRTFNPHACRHCGYDLSSLSSDLCPECGTPIDAYEPR